MLKLMRHITADKTPTRKPGEKTGSVIRKLYVDSGRSYFWNFHSKDFLNLHKAMTPRAFSLSSESSFPSRSTPDLARTDLSSVSMRLSRARVSSFDELCRESRPSPPALSLPEKGSSSFPASAMLTARLALAGFRIFPRCVAASNKNHERGCSDPLCATAVVR